MTQLLPHILFFPLPQAETPPSLMPTESVNFHLAFLLPLIVPPSVQFSHTAMICVTLYDSMDSSIPGFPVHHQHPQLAQTYVLELVMPSNYLVLCRPLLFLPSIFPSIRVFSNKSVLCIRWPKY